MRPGSRVRFFTCRISNSGIGDQLSQLHTLYRIGRSFELTYVHTPLDNRWCPALDINRFLGLDLGEEHLRNFRGYRILDIPYRVLLDQLYRNQPLESLFSSEELRPPVLFRLCTGEEIYSEKPDDRTIHPGIRFDVAAKFAAAHGNVADLNPFRTDKLRVALHIRRGDVCWVEDNGKILFPFRNREVPVGVVDRDLQRALPISYYMSVLDDMFSLYPPDECEIRIYSDGYGNRLWGTMKAKDRVRHVLGLIARYLRIESRRTTRVSIFDRSIRRKLTELKREFVGFQKYRTQIELRIGQSAPLTKEVICAFGWADVIVVARRGAFPDLGLGLNRSQRIVTPGADVLSVLRDFGNRRGQNATGQPA
jgi:hypothetical protein